MKKFKNNLGFTLDLGLPSLGLLPLEPLAIKQFSIGQGKGAISLAMTFRNANIHGITDVKISGQK